MHLPLLPFKLVAIHLETYTFGLHNMKRFDVISKSEVFFFGHKVWEEVESFAWRGDSVSP